MARYLAIEEPANFQLYPVGNFEAFRYLDLAIREIRLFQDHSHLVHFYLEIPLSYLYIFTNKTRPIDIPPDQRRDNSNYLRVGEKP